MAEHPTIEERKAARTYLEHDYAAQHLGGEAGREANRHASEIDERHPRARDIALTGTDRELGELNKALRAHQMRSRKAAGITADHARRIRSQYRAGPGSDIQPERSGRNPRPNRQPGSSVLDASPPNPLDYLDDFSTGRLLTKVIAWGMGLSLLYLFLTHDTAASRLLDGIINTSRAVIAPNVNPLDPKGRGKAAQQAAAARAAAHSSGLSLSSIADTIATDVAKGSGAVNPLDLIGDPLGTLANAGENLALGPSIPLRLGLKQIGINP